MMGALKGCVTRDVLMQRADEEHPEGGEVPCSYEEMELICLYSSGGTMSGSRDGSMILYHEGDLASRRVFQILNFDPDEADRRWAN